MNTNDAAQQNQRLLNHMMQLADKRVWEASLAMTDESLAAFANAPWMAEAEAVLVLGHGSSYAMAQVVAYWIEHLARRSAKAIPAYEFAQYPDDSLLRPDKTVVLGISCGGGTASVAKGLSTARQRGAATICLSRPGDIALARAAEYRIAAHADLEEDWVPCYTMSHQMLLMGGYRLAQHMGERNGSLSADQSKVWDAGLNEAAASMASLPALFEAMEPIGNFFRDGQLQNFCVLGTGPNRGTATEAALKASEMSWLFGAAEETEDFAHGRFREVGDRELLFILSPKAHLYGKTMDILAGCAISRTPAVIFTEESTPAMEKMAKFVVKMPRLSDEALTPFLYMAPLWFFGFQHRRALGQVAGLARHGLFATDINFEAHFTPDGEKINKKEE